MKIEFKKIRDVKSPERGTSVAAGIDFFIPNDYVGVTHLKPQERVLIPSGIKVKLPSRSCLLAVEKSGVFARKGLAIGARLVDEDYQGEIHLSVYNTGVGNQPILPGEKLVQFMHLPVYYSDLIEVQAGLFDQVTERGENGFGSTGDR